MLRLWVGKIVFSIGLLVALAGCQALNNVPGAPAPQPLTGPRASAAGAAALLEYAKPANTGYMLAPVDVNTGRLADGFAPIDLGADSQYAFSADREHLAFASTGASACPEKCLHLLNLRTWKETLQPVSLAPAGNLWASLAFNAAGTTVAVALIDDTGAGGQLLLVDLAQAKVVRKAHISSNVQQITFTPDGSLAVYGSQAPVDGQESHMYAALYDGASLQEAWRQELAGVAYSIETAASLTDPSQGKYLNPAAVFTPDGARLYVVAADLPRLVSVDFARRSAQTFDIQPRQGWLERLLTAGASAAYAKSMNGASKNAALSPDGNTLYVVGQTHTAVKDINGDWTSQMTPLGLQVVDVRDGAELATLDSGAYSVGVSLDGKSLLLGGVIPTSSASASATDLVDAATLKVVQRYDSDLLPSRLLNGETALLALVWADNGANTLTVYDDASLALRSRRQETSDNYAYWIPIP